MSDALRSAQNSPPGGSSVRPLFWRVHESPVHFLASIHFGPPGGFNHGPEVLEAFDQSENIHFEITREDLGLIPDLVRRDSGSLRDELGPELYAQLRGETRYNEELDNVKLPFALLGLAAQCYHEIGLTHENGVEQKLFDRAATNGQRIAGLEGATDQIRSLLGFRNELVVDGFRQVLENPAQLVAMRDLVVTGYIRGDVESIEAARRIMHDLYPEVADSLLRVREDNWMPKLRSLIEGGRPTMVVVGAVHLAGPNNVIARLISEGVSITRLM